MDHWLDYELKPRGASWGAVKIKRRSFFLLLLVANAFTRAIVVHGPCPVYVCQRVVTLVHVIFS